MTLLAIIQLLNSQKQVLQTFGLRRIGVFGSCAREESASSSDIDLLLDFDPTKKTYKKFIASTVFLESLLKRPVDAVTPQALSPYIKPYIEKDITYVQISN
ncbi:nucleotidyltransferase family protein [Patescibacteria group bacterium]|nr:nucleotidyltransferase family protein [Patescibacteria group bacterium]MBU1473169.1 nucleotidyltransferase family protein [Patescibacteria group bacterium]MBU2459936.1 nucleotidyltransferase family protein [Patescibacteria group bacterium]